MAIRTNEIKDNGMTRAIVMTAVAALALVAAGATPQEKAVKINEILRKNLKAIGEPYWRPYGHSEKTWYLQRLYGIDAKLIDEDVRVKTLKTSFIGAIHDRDESFAVCVLMRIRREVKGFSRRNEEALIEKAFSTAQFADDYGKSLFQDRFSEALAKSSSPAGYALVRMRAIRLEPFILRPPMTLDKAVTILNRKAVAADYVNGGMGVKFDFKHGGFYGDPPEIPKVQVGEYTYGNVGVTLEEAAKAIAGSVGYAFEIRSDGVVEIVVE